MKTPEIPSHERERLAALQAYGVLDTASEPAFDALTELAAHIAQVPIALVSLVDADRQWFKSRYGLEAPETPRDVSFCGHVVASERVLLVTDALQDERFADNPLVVGGPCVRFYLGVPLRTEEGFVLGTLCAIDHQPRELSPEQQRMLVLLARQVVDQLELRRRNQLLARSTKAQEIYRRFFDQSLDLLCTVNEALYFQELNPAWQSLLGWTLDELRSAPLVSLLHPDDVDPALREAQRVLAESSITVDFATRFRHRDGHWVPLSWVATVRDNVFFAAARDMTRVHAKQRELELLLEQVSEARSRFQSILASANYSIIETTPDGTIREFNPAAERMLGYAAEEMIQKHSPALIHDPTEVEARARELSAELGVHIEPGFEAFVAKPRRGIPDEREWTYIRKDGSRFPVMLSITARTAPDGSIAGFIGIAMDLTARRQAETKLRQGELLLKTVFDGMAEGVVVQGRTGAIQEANAAAERILGLSRDQLLGRACVDPRWGSTHPDGTAFPGEEHPAMIALRTGAAQQDVPMAVSRTDGTRVLVSINARPLRLDSDDVVDAVVTTFRDITQQAVTEQALRDSEARSRAIIQTAADAIITIDERGRIERVNEAVEKLFGFTPDELLGANVRVLMPSPDYERHDGYLTHYVSGGPKKIIGVGREVVARRKDGTTFPADLAISEFFLNGSRYFAGVIRDISDRKQVERMQAEFVSTVSHELRTPLTSIRGSLGLIAGGVLGELPKEAKVYVDIALSNCQRLVRLINDILDIEKVRSDSIEFRMAAVDLATALQTAVSTNQAYAAAHDVRLELVGGVPPGEVLVDADRLAQALANLISNAAKFSPAAHAVELSVERRADMVRINVRDHGPGIAKEFEARIFQRFAQADSSTTRHKGGTGLGLSITKAIIERMGGQIGFRAAEGGGTIFYFELPYLHPVRGSESLPPCVRVLVCEDDLDVAHMLEEVLQGAGYEVHIAPTLERARRLLSRHRYAAVTLDMVLADGDAGPLLAELQSSHSLTHVPVVVVSGSEQAMCTEVGTPVIPKPFDTPRLLAAVANAVAQPRQAPRLLHVESDPDLIRIVRKTLPESWRVVGAESVQAAERRLLEEGFDIVVLELSMPDGEAARLLDVVGRAQVVLFSAADAPVELSRRVAAALVKSRSTPADLHAAVRALLAARSVTLG